MSEQRAPAGTQRAAAIPWQLRMFAKTLKKRQKVALILSQIRAQVGDLAQKNCLLVTNGDNNGAMNWAFRDAGGRWTWAENEAEHIREMEELLGEPVLVGGADRIPVPDESQDVVVSIDVHEHLTDCAVFNRELQRVAKPGGVVIVSTPSGDAWKPVTVLKNLVGMTKEKYGHVVIGYNVSEHQQMLSAVGLRPVAWGTYSKFFTEIIELMINFAFVMVLSRRKKMDVKQGTIAPSSADQLRKVEKQIRLYSAVYPVLWTVSQLDRLLFFLKGYAVSVVARRPETA